MGLFREVRAVRRARQLVGEAGFYGLLHQARPRTLWRSPGVDLGYKTDGSPGARGLDAQLVKLRAPLEPGHGLDANLISSLLPSGKHLPVLDCDYPVYTAPSTRPGHGHLYLDVEVTWPRYVLFLLAAAHAGIIEWAFVWTSVWRGMTAVRTPWTRKRLSTGDLTPEWRAAARAK